MKRTYIKRVYTIFIVLLLSLGGNAQNLKSLINKEIYIPCDIPQNMLFTETALIKNNYKPKYLYSGSIKNKPVIIEKIELINKGTEKESVVILLNSETEKIVLYYPGRIKRNGNNYYVRIENDFLSGLYYAPYQKMEYLRNHNIIESVKLPHYIAENIESFEKKCVGNSYYIPQNTQGYERYGKKTLYVNQLVKDQVKGQYYIDVTIDNENESIYINPYDDDNALTYFISLRTIDSLKEAAKNSKRTQFFNDININYSGKEIHIEETYCLNSNYEWTSINEGYYTYIGSEIIEVPKGGGMFDSCSKVQSVNTNQIFWIPFCCEEFHSKIILADKYRREKTRKKLEAEEQEKLYQQKLAAEEKTEHNRLVKAYGAANAKLIEDGVIKLGFSKKMVEEAWGYPDDTTIVTNYNGTIECWIYGLSSFVYFRNGKVVQIIE